MIKMVDSGVPWGGMKVMKRLLISILAFCILVFMLAVLGGYSRRRGIARMIREGTTVAELTRELGDPIQVIEKNERVDHPKWVYSSIEYDPEMVYVIWQFDGYPYWRMLVELRDLEGIVEAGEILVARLVGRERSLYVEVKGASGQ
jgi:hypothetical protein